MHLSKKETSGLWFAFIGVFFFSLSLPMTKWALESFDPLFTAFFRPIMASVLAIPLLFIRRVPLIPRQYLKSIIYVTVGTALIWPTLIALALQRTT
ncbi:MAG: EamA family transporter, partial [Actinobacteria bacterium]|nr:EamA family transporter [Actinomycetota bacterium]